MLLIGYTGELNSQEDRLATLQIEKEELDRKHELAQSELETMDQKIAFDERF